MAASSLMLLGFLDALNTVTRDQPRNRVLAVSICAASTYLMPFPNDVRLSTNIGFVPDLSVVTCEIFKLALLNIVEAWEPAYCAAYPDTLRAFGKKGSYFREVGMQYLCPWLGSLVTPPAPVITEHLPGGGLLMSATTETFDVANPAHIAAARAIGAAIAPLNVLPWEARARA